MHKGGHPLVPKSPDTGLFVIALKHRRQWSCLIPLIILGWTLVITIAFPGDSLATDANGPISVEIQSWSLNPIQIILLHSYSVLTYTHPVVFTPSILDQGQQVGTAVHTVYPDDHSTAQRSTLPTQIWTGRIVSEQYLV